MIPALALSVLLQGSTGHVRLHADADRLRAVAARAPETQRWADAAAQLFAAARESGDRLIAPDPGSEPDRFISISDWVAQVVAGWPPEGRAAFRAMLDPWFDLQASAAVRRRDAPALLALARTWPQAAGAEHAVLAASAIARDGGDTPLECTALRLWERLFAERSEHPAAWARLADALARSGDAPALAALAARRFPENAAVLVGDRAIPLADYIRSLRADPDAAPLPPGSMWNGPAGPSAPAAPAEPPPIRLRVGFPYTYLKDPQRFVWEDSYWHQHESERVRLPLPVVRPACAEGIVVIASHNALRAWPLYSESMNPIWFHMSGGPDSVLAEPLAWNGATIHEGRVFAALVTDEAESIRYQRQIVYTYPFPRRALFALDAATGRVLWRIGGRAGTRAIPDGLSFCGAPAARGGVLYACATLQERPQNFFEHHLVAVRASDGAILWTCFLTSGNTETNLFGNSIRDSIALPVLLCQDRAIVCTNIGAVAAVDLLTGRVAWLTRYPQVPRRPTRSIFPGFSPPGWAPMPPRAAGDTVLVAPTDADSLFGFDLETGRITWRLPRPFEPAYFLGMHDGAAVVAQHGPMGRVEAYPVGARAPRWRIRAPVSGPGVIAGDALWLPTPDGVAVFDLRDPHAEPVVRRIGPPSDPAGRAVITLPTAVVLAGSGEVHVFADSQAERERVRRARADPQALPLPELYLAAVDAVSLAPEEAQGLLEAVLARRGGVHPYASGARRFLADVLGRAAADALRRQRWEIALRHLERARALVPPEMRADVDLAAADALEQAGRVADAIALLQALAAAGGDPAAVARRRIDELLRRHGLEPYAPFEREAERLRRAARTASDAARLLLRAYPSSRAARTALHDAVAEAREAGRLTEAVERARDALREFPEENVLGDEAPRLVDALEGAGYAHAAASLLRALRGRPGGEWAARRLANAPDTAPEPPPPAFSAPPVLRGEARLSGRAGRPIEPTGRAVAGFDDIVFLDSGDRLAAIRFGHGLLWSVPARGNVHALVLFDDRAVACTSGGALGLSLADGSVLWRHEGGRWGGWTLAGGWVCAHAARPESPGSEIVAIEPFTSEIAWRVGVGEAGSATLAAAGAEWIAALTPADGRVRLIEAATGRVAWDAQFNPRHRPALVGASRDHIFLREQGVGMRILPAGPAGQVGAPYDLVGVASGWLLWAPGRIVEVLPAQESLQITFFDCERLRLAARSNETGAGWPHRITTDGRILAMESRIPGRLPAVLRAYDLDGRRWILGEEISPVEKILDLRVADGHTIALLAEEAENIAPTAGIAWRLRVWNLEGREVMNRSGRVPADALPGVGVPAQGLVLSVGESVEIWR